MEKKLKLVKSPAKKPKRPGKKHWNGWLSDTLLERAENYAHREKRSVVSVIELSLELYLKHNTHG